MDDAGHGIGAIERALRASYEFQAVGFSERNDAEVDCSPGIVNGDIVHNDLVVARVSAAHKQRGNSASSSIGVHDCAGQKSQRFGGRDRVHDFQLSMAEAFDIRARDCGGNGSARGGHDYCFGSCRQPQCDSDSFFRRWNVYVLYGKAGGQDPNLIRANAGGVKYDHTFG